jgi:hypothetical protein
MSSDSNTVVFQRSGGINTVYSLFYTYNYTGAESVSSYALPFAGFTFVPVVDDIQDKISRKKLVWDFGDGTTVETVTARHAYKKPGSYKVSCYLYDRAGESYYDSYSVTVDVYNFINDTIKLQTTTNILTASKFTEPITVTRTNSLYTHVYNDSNLTIIPYASGFAPETNFFDTGINLNHYGHLYPYSSFYIRETNFRDITEFVEISSFKTSNTPLFCRLSGTEIVFCDPKDPGALFCGSSGVTDVYFKSDTVNNQVNLMFGFEAESLSNYSNTTTVGLSTRVLPNNDFARLSITANGIESEGTSDTVFNINKNKFSNTPISFVIRAKSSDNFTNKSGPLLNNTDIVLTNGTLFYPITATSNTIGVETLSSGTFLKGEFIVNTQTTLNNVYLVAITSFVSDNKTFFITGSSSTFDIYPEQNIYNIAKRGEDIDMARRFKEISFQPLFLDLHNLYNEFLTNTFGDINSDQTSIGKVTYEKISNFVSNTSISDYSNIENLISLLKQYNTSSIQFNTQNYRYPAAISRLVDLLSIKKTKLFGNINTFNENFISFGYTNNDLYGKNLGLQISIDDDIIPGANIVSYEKFGEVYSVHNTFLPGLSSYKIRDYDSSWGWGLLLPDNTTGNDINNYYTFYQHISTPDGDVQDSIINFDDPNNTLSSSLSSYREWEEVDGIIANILLYEFYKKLNLFNVGITGTIIQPLSVVAPAWPELEDYSSWAAAINYEYNLNL